MRLPLRPLALIAVFGLALACTACSLSPLKGEIEGKWKFDSSPRMDEETLRAMGDRKIYVYLEFTPGGSMKRGMASSDPRVQERLQTGASMITTGCRYRLLEGHRVEFSDIPPLLRDRAGLFGDKERTELTVRIDGDRMTMIADNGKTARLTRWK